MNCHNPVQNYGAVHLKHHVKFVRLYERCMKYTEIPENYRYFVYYQGYESYLKTP
jgi:hypothetical protein